MKRVFAFFFITVLTVFIAPVIMAQVIDPPASIIDLLANLNTYLASMAGVAAMSVFLGALLNGLFKVAKTFVKQLVVWLVAIAVMVISNVANIGYGGEFTYWQSLLHGFGAGLVANGIFDIPIVKAIMEFIEKLFNKPKE